MDLADFFGIAFSALLGIGLVGSLVDLLIKIVRQPKREGPTDWLSLSSYPLVPQSIRKDDFDFRSR